MSRSRYLVTYDVCDEKRLRRVFQILNGFGDHIQYSVFICELNPKERVSLERKLRPIVHHQQDQVLLFRLGTANVAIDDTVDSIGRDFQPSCRTVVV